MKKQGVPLAAALIRALSQGFTKVGFEDIPGFYAWLGGLTLTFVALGRNGGMGGGDPGFQMITAQGIGPFCLHKVRQTLFDCATVPSGTILIPQPDDLSIRVLTGVEAGRLQG